MNRRETGRPANAHAERYRQRREPWSQEAACSELVDRIRSATGVDTARAAELAKQRMGAFSISLDGQLRGPDGNANLRGDPFELEVARIAHLVDREGKLPEPKDFDTLKAERRSEYSF